MNAPNTDYYEGSKIGTTDILLLRFSFAYVIFLSSQFLLFYFPKFSISNCILRLLLPSALQIL